MVDELAGEPTVCLVDALHGDKAVAHAHGNGVKTYYIAEGIEERTILETLGHGEVLQLIVDEAYSVA